MLVLCDITVQLLPRFAAAMRTGTSTETLLHQVLSKLLSLDHGASPPVSPSQIAHGKLETLGRIADGITVAAPCDGPSILSAAQQDTLSRLRHNEYGLVNFLTPILAELRLVPPSIGDPCCPVLVNSELLQWLVHPSSVTRPVLSLKPDLFLSWAPFVDFRDGNEALGQGAGPSFRFGVLASYALHKERCVAEIFEAKKGSLVDCHFGELCTYHDCVPGTCRGVVFGATDFWLYESYNGSPTTDLLFV
jgi:hypothetical protein